MLDQAMADAIQYNKYKLTTSKISKYIRNKTKKKNAPQIFRKRSFLLGIVGDWYRINIFSSYLEWMGQLIGHQNKILCLESLSPTELASASTDGTIKIWDLERKVAKTTLFLYNSSIVSALCYISPNIIICGNWDGEIIIYEMNTKRRRILNERHKSHIVQIIKTEDEEIVSGDYMGDLRVWEAPSGNLLLVIPSPNIYNLMSIKLLGNNHKNNNIIACGGYAKLTLRERGNLLPLKEYTFREMGKCYELMSPVLFVRGLFDGGMEVRDLDTGGCLWTISRLFPGAIRSIIKVAKGLVIITAQDSSPIAIKIVDLLTRKCYFRYMESVQYLRPVTKLY